MERTPTMMFWHIKDNSCLYTYTQEKEVPPLNNQHLKLSIISLRKKEQCILELILINIFSNLYFYKEQTEQPLWRAADPG